MKKKILAKSVVVAIVILFMGTCLGAPNEGVSCKKNISMDSHSSWGKNQCITGKHPANLRADDKGLHPQPALSTISKGQSPFSGDRGYFYAYEWYSNMFFNFPPTIWLGEAPAQMSGSDFDFEGNWYAVAYNGGLYKVDPGTGSATFIGSTTSLNSLVYDTTMETWYTCGTDSSGIDSLFTIDITTGATTFIGHFGTPNFMISLMCDTDGNMYSYDVLFGGNSNLYSIDTDTGEATVIGDMGHNFCFAQEGKFDRNTGILYLAAYDVGIDLGFWATCDPATGEVTILNYFSPNEEIDALTAAYGDTIHYPHAAFTWTPSDPRPGDTILFNASTSYDYDGHITLYEWDWNNDGVYEESHTTQTTTHAWDNPGSYQVTLRVTDNASLTGIISHLIEVVNQPPVTPIISGPNNGLVNYNYTFSIGPISDPDGDSMYSKWDWGDGNITDWLGPYGSGQIVTASHAWTHVGVYEIRAKLKDTFGSESNWSEPFTITIIENGPPAIPTISGPSDGIVNHDYTFSIGPISDPDGDSMYCKWDWGDGNITEWLGPYSSGQIIYASHLWILPGIYEIRAKLKDTYGLESNWSEPHPMTIIENEPPTVPSITGSSHGKPQTDYPYTVVTTDPNGDNVSYYIDWGDNTSSGWMGPYESSQEQTFHHSWSKKGTYTITVKARDDLGAESDWGRLPVTIPCSFIVPMLSFFEWLFERFPHAFPLLRYLVGLFSRIG
jgi:hypothetical protein